MGGKNKAPAAPNYQPIAAADEAAARIQAQTAGQQLDFAKQQFATNQAEINPLIQSETNAANAQTANAKASYDRYTTTEVPQQDKYLAEANQYSDPAYAAQQAGTAVGNVDAAYTGQRNQQQQQMQGYGIDPGAGRYEANNQQLGASEAAAKAAAGTASTQNTRLTGLNLQANAENMLAGLPGQSTSEYGGGNSSGQTATGNALGLTASGVQSEGTGLQYSGLQQSSLNNWGNTLSSSYNAQLGQFQANQQASSGFGAILGTVGGIAASKFLARGGVVGPEQPLAHGGMAIPDDLSYARGGPVAPRGVSTHIKQGSVPHFSMHTFKPHLMNAVHPHTSSSVGPGGNPRVSTSGGMGRTGSSPGAGKGMGVPVDIESTSAALGSPGGGGGYGGGGDGGGGYGGGGGSTMLAEGGAIPSNKDDPYGRADNIPMTAKAGSYIVPKSVVQKLGTHHFDKMIAQHGDHQDKQAAHLRLQGIPTAQHGDPHGDAHIKVSAGEYMIPKGVVDKLGTHHLDKIVAQHGDATDMAAAEARLAGQPSGAGNGPAIPANQLAAISPRVKLGAIPMMGNA